MASPEEIADLRRKISELDNTNYSDAVLGARIDAADGDLNKVAYSIWQEKAATYAELVDISEAGSSRKNSQLYKNALEMADYYAGIDDDPDTPVPAERSTTRRIVRL